MNLYQVKQRSFAVLFAAVLALAGCHKKVAPPPPAPPPPPPPAPTATITVSPSTIQQGQSATLTWTTANATQVTISGLGTVAAQGSSSVTPTRSTDYTVTAAAAGGASVQASARLTVTPPPVASAPPSLTEEELFEQNVHDIYFDYDKYDIRTGDASTVEQDVAFLKNHPGMKVVIEGNCDERGSAEYNIALGQNRAGTLKLALIHDGVDASRIRTVSYGSEKPVCTEETESCWQKNRHDHLKLDR